MPQAAAIQMCSTGNVDENLAQAEQLIAEAADSGVCLAVLPEMFALLGCQQAEKMAHQETPGSGKIQDFLQETAAKHQIWLVGGTLPMQTPFPNKVRAACLVFSDDGQPAARYDKIHMFDVQLPNQETYCESATTEPGQQIVVLETPIGKLGLCVCFDLRFPPIFAELSRLGAEVIAIPAAFAVQTGQAHWEVLLRCRAIDTLTYVIAAAQSGHHPNQRQTYGHSMLVNPWGTILAEQVHPGPGLVSAEIDLPTMSTIRSQLPILNQ